MMYVLIVLLMFVAALVAGNAFLTWLLAEASEERQERDERPRQPRSFYNPRTWIAFRRLLAKRPALLMYRRDKHGRFRKMSTPSARSAPRAPRRRSNRRTRPPSARQRVQVPAE